ncbi:MAG: ComF family protein [Pseudomonadota bacterium]
MQKLSGNITDKVKALRARAEKSSGGVNTTETLSGDGFYRKFFHYTLASTASLARLSFPQSCLVCNRLANSSICCNCYEWLPFNVVACRICAKSQPASQSEKVCGECLVNTPLAERTISVFRYHPPIIDLIQRMKYAGGFPELKTLATHLSDHVSQVIEDVPEVILPVPLHAKKQRQRGYNQSHEICRHVSADLGIPTDRNVLRRVKNTSSQAGLTEIQRTINMRSAFDATNPKSYRHVGLVDDVITSGSTVRSAMMALKRSGIKRIQVWSIAKT